VADLRNAYPFSALVGQAAMRLALCLNAVNPTIGGVLIRGERGTAKSTAVRALARLLPEQRVVAACRYGCDPTAPAQHCSDCRRRLASGELPLPESRRRMRVVELPINASEDRVVGTIDLEAALQKGAKRFQPGVLAEANRNLLYVDEVNLLDDHIVDVLLDAAAMGVNVVEREGVSVMHPARFILVGTMNPEEGDLRPQLLDRFGLCVDVRGIRDPDLRVEIAEREAAFKAGDAEFLARFRAEDLELAGTLAAALPALPDVRLGPGRRRLISSICLQADVQGHRGDVVIERTARTLAALRGHRDATAEDVYDAADLALSHRARYAVRREQEELSPQDGRPSEEANPEGGERAEAGDPGEAAGGGEESEGQSEESAPAEAGEQAAGAEQGSTTGSEGRSENPIEAEDTFSVRKIELARQQKTRKTGGKRQASKASDRRGRYVRAESKEKVTDLAVDATVRAAAPHQARRGRARGERLRLERHDLQQKVRERKVGNLIVFVVDASASMDAEQRMAATKGAVLSLLQDAYVRRDKVALIVFKNRTAEVVLRPTASVSLAQRRLERLSVGGTTPLTHGLMAGYTVIKSQLSRDPTIRPLLVLISDGRGNISMFKEEPLVEAQKMAALIKSEKIEALIIDSARDYSAMASVQHLARVAPMYQSYALNACSDLAERMDGRYYGIYDLSREEIAAVVANQLSRRR